MQQPLKRLIAELVGTEATKLRFGPMQPFDDLPEYGGFGYAMGWSTKM